MATAFGQGSVKVASGQVYALHPKRPLTRLSRDCEIAALCPGERAELATPTRARNDSPLPRAERVPHLPLDTAAPPPTSAHFRGRIAQNWVAALSPGERGCPAPALPPAGAGRVRGRLLSFANQPLQPRGRAPGEGEGGSLPVPFDGTQGAAEYGYLPT